MEGREIVSINRIYTENLRYRTQFESFNLQPLYTYIECCIKLLELTWRSRPADYYCFIT